MLAGTVAATTLVGCPKNTCFLTYCSNGVCSCPVSSCPDGASYDLNQSKCQCDTGKIPLDGQCLSPQAANEYCGKGFHYDSGGCVPTRCGPNEELDLSTGGCLPRQKMNEVASTMGVQVGEGQKLGCPPGNKLVVEGNSAACVPDSQTCAPDEVWSGQACTKIAQCPTGQAWNAALGKCVAFAQTGGSEAMTVDVAQWSASNYGPDGGQGTGKFCGSFAKKPWSFGVSEGQSAMIRVAITMAFPEGKIAQGAVRTAATFASNGRGAPQAGADAVQSGAQGVFTLLQLGGGQAATPTTVTTVQCPVVNAAKPIPVPATGGV
jgi:hypothetical protein